jgi:hypothetical protein
VKIIKFKYHMVGGGRGGGCEYLSLWWRRWDKRGGWGGENMKFPTFDPSNEIEIY